MADTTLKATDALADNLSSLLATKFTGEPAGDIKTIYDFLEAADPGICELLLSNDGNPFRIRFFHTLFTSENSAFYSYCSDPKTGEFIEAYLSAVPGIYKSYKEEHPEGTDMAGLAERAAKLVMHGMKGGE